jgi:RNA recognition motif-containing protein
MVTNLADGVTDDDIKELFESCGKLKYAGIHWDRRCGITAQIISARPLDCFQKRFEQQES